MSTLPVTGATELVSGQALPETSVNEALRHLDVGHSRARPEDRDLTAPPGSCVDGACYLVDATATGAWAGQDGKLAIAVGTDASNGWLFQNVEREGFRLYIKDEDVEIQWDGAAWVTVAASFNMAPEWTPNFTADGDVYIAAVEAMTIDEGVAQIGTGTLAYEKSTTAAPSTFSATTLPVSLQAGAWLKVSATGVTGFVAAHLVRTA